MVNIRAAEPGDVSKIAVINVRGWQAGFREIIPEDFLHQMDPEERESFVDQMISNGAPYHVAVADDQGEVVGYVMLGLPVSENPLICPYQGRGSAVRVRQPPP